MPNRTTPLVGEKAVLGPDWVQKTVERVTLVRQNLLAAQSRQKSYADVRRRDLEFKVGEQVLLRVSPTKGVVRFGTKKGSLARGMLDLLRLWLGLES